MNQNKPTAYLETNIFSSLCYRGGGAVASIRQLKMAEWWELERRNFNLFTSRHTEKELLAGKYVNQFEAIAAARRIAYLPFNAKAEYCFRILMSEAVFPLSETADAIHLAIATVHRIDYLLTWNQAHLANPEVQNKLEHVASKNGWRSPWLFSPDSMPWKTLGQNVGRKDA